MSSEEISLLYVLGNKLLVSLIQVTTSSIIYGAFVLLFSISSTAFLHRGLTGRPARLMFTATIISFLIATIHSGSHIAGFAILIRAVFIDNTNIPLDMKRDLTNMALIKPNIIGTWTTSLAPVLTDAVVVWRAWVLFTEQRWLMSVPVSLLLSSIVITFAYLGLISSPSGIESAIAGGSVNNLFLASLVLSLATNLIATSLIAYKLWHHRQLITKSLGLHGRTSAVQKTLVLLVESGIFYCTLQVIYLILEVSPRVEAQYTRTEVNVGLVSLEVFSASYFAFSGMYPTIVIVLVNSQRSFALDISGPKGMDGPSPSIGSRPVTYGHLSFSPPDQTVPETGSQSSGTSRDGEVLEKPKISSDNRGLRQQVATAPF